MWMMGYGEAEDLNMNMQVESYANNGSRKLRPLVPRPSCFRSSPHDHLLPVNHHGEQQQHKREFHSQSQQMVVVSSRWNPTPEQLQTLEELYRRGTRTPSADEIQHITAQLRRYGKIEGKNVFYWFQNHKARERQKRRRQLHQPPADINTITVDAKHSEVNRTSNEVEETRNWAIPTFSEKIGLTETTTKEESRVTSIADQGWLNVEHQEEENDELLLPHRRWKSLSKRNVMWTNMMQCLSSSTPPNNHNSTSCIQTVTPSATKMLSSLVVSPRFRLDVDSYQTLELFPITSSGHGLEEKEKCFQPTSDINISPRRFIEFLPLKN